MFFTMMQMVICDEGAGIMTEKEKMLKQMMYDANYDKELLQERNQAKDLCYEYNQLRPSDEQGQKAVMRLSLIHI